MAALSRNVMSVISPERWAAARTTPLPPYPPALREFLDDDCTIWPGRKRHETHIVVPLFPHVLLNGAIVPLTLESLDELDKSSGGPGYRYLWDQIPADVPAEGGFRWAVMTNDVIPGSRNLSYAEQCKLLPPGYEAPGVLNAARAILWENRCSGRRCFTDAPWTYTRCRENVQGYQLVVGGFAPAGLHVNGNFYGSVSIGLAGWREF